MNGIRKNWYLLVTLICFLCSPLWVNGQEWSDKQKEVWSEVESYWELHAKGDLDGFLTYFHEDYLGWYNRSTLPGDKASLKTWLKPMFEMEKVLVYEIKPVGISIHGKMAIVHYFYSQMSQQKPEKMKFEQGRWTDILMKDGGKWKLVGDHGGPKIVK